MTMPIEGIAAEVVANNSELNIKNAKHTAQVELRKWAIGQNLGTFSDDVDLISYNSIRNHWVATFSSWYHPDIFITVQYAKGSVFVRVDKMIQRAVDNEQATLFE